MHIVSLIENRLADTYDLHRRYVNPQFVRVLEAIGFNRNYTAAKGVRLTDANGREVLDFLAGFDGRIYEVSAYNIDSWALVFPFCGIGFQPYYMLCFYQQDENS